MVSQSHAGFLMPGLNADAARKSTDLPFRCWSDDDGPGAALTALLNDCGATATGLSVVLDETMRYAHLADDPVRQAAEENAARLGSLVGDIGRPRLRAV